MNVERIRFIKFSKTLVVAPRQTLAKLKCTRTHLHTHRAHQGPWMPGLLNDPKWEKNQQVTIDSNSLAKSALLQLGEAPSRHQHWQGKKWMFLEICSTYELDLWMGRSGRRTEGREVTGERSLVYILAQDERWFNPTQLFHNPPRDSLTHTDTLFTSTCKHTTYI